MPTWFEDETFWMAQYPYLFPEDQFALAEDTSTNSWLWLPRNPRRVGSAAVPGDMPGSPNAASPSPGWISRPFYSPKASPRAGDTVAVELRDDMRHLCARAYDLVVSLCTSFGYFDDPQDDRRVLQNIFRSLKPLGCVSSICWAGSAGENVSADHVSQAPDGTLDPA
jgi:SAM-dependent methyltransferase